MVDLTKKLRCKVDFHCPCITWSYVCVILKSDPQNCRAFETVIPNQFGVLYSQRFPRFGGEKSIKTIVSTINHDLGLSENG